MKWVCPYCPELRHGSRHWSVGRHIARKHNCIGEPVSLNTGITRSQMGLDPFPYQVYRTNGVPNGRAFTPNHPDKKNQLFDLYDWFEKQILTPLRQNVEFVNLSDQLNRKYLQGKVAWNTTNQYPSTAFGEPLKIETANLFGCIYHQCEHCLGYEIYPFYFYDQGNIESKTTKVDHVCTNNNPLMLARFLSYNEKKFFIANQTILVHSELKTMILNQWSNNNILYLFAIKLPNSYTKVIVKISDPSNPCNKSVALEYLPEHKIKLNNMEDDHWANRVIGENIKRVILNDAELTDFLNTANNATFGFFKVRTKTCDEVYLMIVSPLASLNIIFDN